MLYNSFLTDEAVNVIGADVLPNNTNMKCSPIDTNYLRCNGSWTKPPIYNNGIFTGLESVANMSARCNLRFQHDSNVFPNINCYYSRECMVYVAECKKLYVLFVGNPSSEKYMFIYDDETSTYEIPRLVFDVVPSSFDYISFVYNYKYDKFYCAIGINIYTSNDGVSWTCIHKHTTNQKYYKGCYMDHLD